MCICITHKLCFDLPIYTSILTLLKLSTLTEFYI